MNLASRLIAAVGMLLLSSATLASAHVVATDAWIPQAPPAASMLAGYLTLKNEGDSAARLLAVQSDRFQSATVHRTVIENGVARMRELNHLEIAPGEEIRFAPGGIHLMLMQPRSELLPGERIEITFLFSDGQRLRAIFDVQAAEAASEHAGEHAH